MHICEYSYDQEDPNSPGYSLPEVDYYAWIPHDKRVAMPNHRLSLRKNLVTQEWEFYRAYHHTARATEIQAGRERAVMLTHTPSGIEEVAFKTKDFQAALDYGNAEWNRWHKTDDYDRIPDKACTHGETGTTATYCAVLRGLVKVK